MRCVKITAWWFGDRDSPPRNATEAEEMLTFWWRQESSVDHRIEMDSVVVISQSRADGPLTELEYELLGYEGLSLKNGCLRVLTRPNGGLSFGAFAHAFRQLRNEYANWLFVEDDQIIVRDGVMSKCVEQLRDATVGFVALVGVGEQYGLHAHGGCGAARRDVLDRVAAGNGGELPHLKGWTKAGQRTQDTEVAFTNPIHRLGYRLVDLDLLPCYTSWKDSAKRFNNELPRHIDWEEASK